jgi:hypothetical protein
MREGEIRITPANKIDLWAWREERCSGPEALHASGPWTCLAEEQACAIVTSHRMTIRLHREVVFRHQIPVVIRVRKPHDLTTFQSEKSKMKITSLEILKSPHSRLAFVLALIAIHSFLVGLGLIVRPGMLMEFLGFGACYERFFPTQGGVFHVAMAIAYAMAAVDVRKCRCLVFFSIIVKTIATIYLFVYYLIVNSMWIVLASGIVDGVMAVAICLSLLSYDGSTKKLDKKMVGLT